jgi:hypothetical protein
MTDPLSPGDQTVAQTAEPAKLPPAPELLAAHDTTVLRRIRTALTVRNDPAALANALANFATLILDAQIFHPDRVERDKGEAEDKAKAEKEAEEERLAEIKAAEDKRIADEKGDPLPAGDFSLNPAHEPTTLFPRGEPHTQL